MTFRSILARRAGGSANEGAIELACRWSNARFEGFHVLSDVRTAPAMAGGDMKFLHWHGVPVQPRASAFPADRSVGEALLEAAGASGADLLAMGGYRHRSVTRGDLRRRDAGHVGS